MADRRLDVRGLNCPLPVLKARKQLAAMAAGERLEVLATDPKAPADFAELCAAAGHRLLASEERAGEYRFLIERAPAG
ncbi:MAG: transcriptional regulator [Geminicoccaceae bacterium]|jgi:tRNA 2-thiouridine synthesizing protein A|nr:MAG: transcriptional regulator [Geminicoccaceae bacterium]